MFLFRKMSIIGLILIVIFSLGCITNDSQNNGVKKPQSLFVALDGSTNYNSIQDAINASSINDTIFVNSGTYFEHLIIDKKINLVGENKKTTIIDGNGSDDVVLITADNVSFSYFTIRNSGDIGFPSYDSGIQINANHVKIFNNTFVENPHGIYCYNGSFNLFFNNSIQLSIEYGMYLSSCFNNSIINNLFFSNECSLKIKGSQECDIIRNNFNDSQKGMYFCCASKNNVVYHNSFQNNVKWNGDDQVGLNNWSNLELEIGNYWDDYEGIDANGDGIGDTPYIPENEAFEDAFPLISYSKV